MTCEYECYCNHCHKLVSWTSDEHDGETCPECGWPWFPLAKPLPLPSRWLREALARHMAKINRDARIIDIAFVGLALVILAALIISVLSGGY